MEVEEIDSDLDSGSKGPLPTFINVLTILTFVGAGLFMLAAVYNVSSIEKQKRDIEILKESGMLENNPFGDISGVMDVALKYVWELNITSFVCCALCILAAVMMRKLKKLGFFIYLFAQIIGVAVPLYFMSGHNSIFSIVIGLIFPLAFVIMYGVNFKHMKY